MMYQLLFTFILGICTVTVFAQTATVEQPTEPFPFAITLYQPDSAAVDSKNIFLQKNNATLVAFWLTTCFPCSNELEAYSQNYESWKKEYGLEIIAVSMDMAEKFRKIEARMAEKHYPFPVYWDRIRAFKSIMPGGLNGYPQVFLFDKNGQLVWRKKGYLQGDELKMIEEVKKMTAR